MDTTANTLKYVILYLCKHPHWQDKLRQEAIAAGKSPQMKAFVCEVQRLHPAVPLGVPHANKTPVRVKLSEGKAEVRPMTYWSPSDLWACLWDGWRVLPKGTMVMALHWHTNRSAKVWEEPLKFEPMRFIDKDGQFDISPNLIPFQVTTYSTEFSLV